jgi:conjugative relaxase-like TrwC/TraI family protein
VAAEIADPYERWMAKHEIRRSGGHASVAAWDCTFSPPKSVSLLWAAGDGRVQAQVWAAHLAAVDAGLGYLQEHAAYVRAGRNGVRVLDTCGLAVARMNEWTSRDGDMHLHTHCLVLNRAQTSVDGKWRALDGRALLSARTGAGALYNRTLEAELTRRLGVAWRDRPEGLRELAGVDDELIEAFSSRARAITAAVEQMASAYRDKYGVDAPPAVLSAMARTAWASTRQRKGDLAPAEALQRWEATARAHGRRLARLPGQVLDRASEHG